MAVKIKEEFELFRAHDHEHGGSQKAYLGAGYIAGQRNLLESASEGFEEWQKDYRKGGSIFDHQKEAWQASRLSLMKELSTLKTINEKLEKAVEFYANVDNWNTSSNDSTQICNSDNQTNSLYAHKFTKEEPMGLRGKGDFVGGKLARATLEEVKKLKGQQ